MVVSHVTCYYEYYRVISESKQSYQADQSFGTDFIIIIPWEKLEVTEEIQSHFLDIKQQACFICTCLSRFWLIEIFTKTD